MNDSSMRIAKLPQAKSELLRLRLERKGAREPIAIIGVGCRFPGARHPEAFWKLLRDGVDAITEVPADRWDVDAFYNPNPATPGKMNTRWGGFLEQVDQFDPQFFGISPREAARMDPQQRFLLEVAWEALEDAGQVLERLAGTRTGVFIGISSNDYSQFQLSTPELIDGYASTGNALSIAANRISYVFGLRGPSIAVDTACSASLVAVHLACQSLGYGESTLAVAGGVNLILSPNSTISYSKLGAVAPDGRCKVFDARANGIVRSEGAGVVVLKPLSRALADGDPIYAIIRGSAVNNDGRTNGLTAPSRQAQEAVLREAYRQAGLSASQVQYVEAHGTGTSLGDPIEANALGAVLNIDRPPGRRCALGSVKANIGHLEAAAGIAGLIKVVLMMKHRMLPPSLHFGEPNPHIPFEDLALRVVPTLEAWPNDAGPLIAGVSAFGFGGTNAHVVLQEAPNVPVAYQPNGPPPDRAYLLPVSAHSPEALKDLVRAYQDSLATQASHAIMSLHDVCYTVGVRRSHHDCRLALVVHSREELAEHLAAFLRGEARPGLCTGRRPLGRRRKLAFVFPGQGAQWWAMGRELLEREPVFRGTLELCDQLMRKCVGWSLLRELAAAEDKSRLNETDICQPAVFALQVALAALWRSWGIEPDAVVGHSMGEVAATHVAGALSLEDAVRVIVHRSRLLKTLTGRGMMAAVGLSAEQAQEALVGYEDRLSIASINGPTSAVLSGDPAALQEVLAALQHQGIFCRLLRVDNAGHSPQIDDLRDGLVQSLEDLQPQPGAVPVYSTVTGQASKGVFFDAAYWGRNLREPVLFSAAVHQLVESGHVIFLELSPHPILSEAISENLRQRTQEGAVLPSLRRGEEELTVMLGSLGALYTLGYPVDWTKLYPCGGRCIRLPSYPWQRERCWLDEEEPNSRRAAKRFDTQRGGRGTTGHPLLGRCVKSAVHPGTYFWETDIGTDVFPYLTDHRVQGAVVLPAVIYLEMALAASEEGFGPGAHVLEKVTFKRMLVLSEGTTQTVQLVVAPEMPGTVSFQFLSRPGDNSPQPAQWTVHVTGTIRLAQTDLAASRAQHDSPEEIRARCLEAISAAEHYRIMAEHGLQYGPTFQCVEQIWRRDGEAVGQLRLPQDLGPTDNAYHVHPALLDACLQVLSAALPREGAQSGGGNTYVPVGLASFRVFGCLGPTMWSNALLRPGTGLNTDTIEGDVRLLDEAGRVTVEALGLRLGRVSPQAEHATQEDVSDHLYEIQWQAKASPQHDAALGPLPPDQRSSWLIFTDASGIGQMLKPLLEAHGQTCIAVSPGETYKIAEPGHYQLNPARPEEFRQLLGDAFASGRPPCRGVVHLWSLEAAPPEQSTLASLESAQTFGCGSVLHLVQALAQAGWRDAPRLWLVTRGAQAVGTGIESLSIAQSPLWGLGRVITHEHSELRCSMVDLSPARTPEEIQSLFEELWSNDHEDQIALRGDARFVARLARYSPEAMRATPQGSPSGEKRTFVPERDHNFRLEISAPGILDNLTLRAATRQTPGPGEVEIQVWAAGLNFGDVLKALGIYAGLNGGPAPLGAECAGKIVRLGEGVEDFRVGDEVIAIAPFSHSAFVTTSTHFVVSKPAQLSFEAATTIPIAFLTACYALYHLGGLGVGERVLIHAAAGGVGLAAVQLAQRVGAEIFATAGTQEKREFLQSLGIQHVMDSRSLAFADEVMESTNGRGVDIVLNSLAGEALAKSVSVLGPYGRFLEIGRRDIHQNTHLGLEPFRKNLSFFGVDIERVCRERPLLVQSLLRDLLRSLDDGTLSPLPMRVFPVSGAESAFRYMAQAKHIGKIVVSMQGEEVLITPASTAPVPVMSDSTYLITGGLGGLGLHVARWLVSQGARHLVLMGRSSPSEMASEAVETMRAAGVQVVVAQADVAREEQVANVLSGIDCSMPPLRGVIHAAGILDDGILLRLDQDRFRRVAAPKMSGAWNLHVLTLEKPLDFFVLFSSAASLLGSPGQGNYSASNAFLDALAHYRRSRGLPALSINWGPWGEVGQAAQDGRGDRLALRGIASLTPEQGLEALRRLLHVSAGQVAVIPLNLRQWRQLYPKTAEAPLLSELARDQASASKSKTQESPIRKALLAVHPGPRRASFLESHLQGQIAQVLRLSPSRIHGDAPLDALGIDSLMGLELRNRLEASLGLILPATLIWRYPTIAALIPYLAREMEIPLDSSAASRADSEEQNNNQTSVLAELEQLSEDEVEALLIQKLETIEEGRSC